MSVSNAEIANDRLADFQHAFARALIALRDDDKPAPAGVAALASQPGFAVYRNTVIKSCIDALQANYPAVARLTGDEWFRAAAAVYVRQTLPGDPTLLYYGASFAMFLENFEPAAELPYLPGVARLDRLWTEAHTARDEAPLDPAVLAGLSPAALATAVLHPHAAARWAWFPQAPVFSIWSHNRALEMANDGIWEPDWQAEGALITRARGAVEWTVLDAAGFAFLEACAHGAIVSQATTAALTVQPDADLQKLMAVLLRANAFNRIGFARIHQP